MSADKTGRDAGRTVRERDDKQSDGDHRKEATQEAWRMMNFRQRMGWVGVALYLLLSAIMAYYVFEVHSFSLERVQRGTSALPPAIAARLPPLPGWIWALVFLLPYLQLFLVLFSCTRADPHAVGYCVLPVCIALLCSRRHTKTPSRRSGSLIDT